MGLIDAAEFARLVRRPTVRLEGSVLVSSDAVVHLMSKQERQKRLWSAGRVQRILRDADRTFSLCWKILAELKEGRPHRRLIEFQGLLASALFKLSAAHSQIGIERIRLVGRKRQLNPIWFRRRLRFLASYQRAFENAVSLGKSLGDALAWFFYQNDAPLLEEHLSHPLSRLMPTGTGGVAELEVARTIHHVDGRFVLHHCVTTLLRIGDISVVEHRPLRVIAIGEMKAGARKGATVDVEVSFRGVAGRGKLFANLSDSLSPGVTSVSEGLTPSAKQRQRRQIRRMDEAVASALKPHEHMSLHTTHTHYWTELQEAIDRAPRGKFSYARLGGGLMVAIYRFGSRSNLPTRLVGKGGPKPEMISDRVAQTAISLLVPRSPYNSLVVDGLHYSKEGWPKLQAGTQPLFWWSLPPSVIRSILFGETLAVTLFNPAPLIERLRTEGFKVESFKPPGDFTLSIDRDSRRLTLGNVEYWLKLVPNALFREEQIVEVIRNLTEEFFAKPFDKGSVRQSGLRFIHSLLSAAELELE